MYPELIIQPLLVFQGWGATLWISVNRPHTWKETRLWRRPTGCSANPPPSRMRDGHSSVASPALRETEHTALNWNPLVGYTTPSKSSDGNVEGVALFWAPLFCVSRARMMTSHAHAPSCKIHHWQRIVKRGKEGWMGGGGVFRRLCYVAPVLDVMFLSAGFLRSDRMTSWVCVSLEITDLIYRQTGFE